MKFYPDEIIFKTKGTASLVCKSLHAAEGWSFAGATFGVKFPTRLSSVKNRELVLLKWERSIQ